MSEEKVNQGSFIEHLTELRSRLLKSIIYLFAFFLKVFGFFILQCVHAKSTDQKANKAIP